MYSRVESSYCPIDDSTLIHRLGFVAARMEGQWNDSGLDFPVMSFDDPAKSMSLAWNCWCTVWSAVSTGADR